MDIAFKERFLGLWEKYFNGTCLPVIFTSMVANMAESFLATGSWAMVKKRIAPV
jgi:hypothetical protein